MTFNPTLIEKIRQLLQNPVQPPSIFDNRYLNYPAARARRIINSIPAFIADAIINADDRSASVMSLVKEHDLLEVDWRVRWFGCDQDQLCGAALSVYGWCQLNGLNPYLAPPCPFSPVEIQIHWNRRQLQKDLQSKTTFPACLR